MSMSRRQTPGRRHSRGLSLVELMVGVAVGLFVVAAAALLSSSQLVDNRSLLIETQLQQDLRATSEFIARELRRNGGDWNNVWTFTPAADDSTTRSVHQNVIRRDSLQADTTELTYSYISPTYPGSFRIRLFNNVIETCRSESGDWDCTDPSRASGYQPLSDSNTVKITALSINPTQAGTRAKTDNGNVIPLPCENLCTANATSTASTNCWPTTKVHELVIWLTGESVADPRIVRTLKTTVRVRNADWKFDADTTVVPVGAACPGLPY